ncbi:MAG: S1 RNA-binding domain-containing protein, partial [Pseudomonadota bacterium]
MTESFAQLFEESLKTTPMKPGVIVHGTVVEVRPDFVVVNAGLKTEGVIPAEQFKDENGNITVKV